MKAYLVAVLLAVLASGSAFATNGFEMIGVSSASISQGGTGVGNVTTGMDAMYKNPALLTYLPADVGKVNVEVNGTFIKPNATADGGLGQGARTSTGGGNFLPNIAATYKLSDKFGLGLGLVSSGGNNTNYVTDVELSELQSQMAVMRLMLGASYDITPWLTIGVTPFITYGQLSLNSDTTLGSASQSTRDPHGATGFGIEAGVASHPCKGVTVGASFTSAQNLTYGQLAPLNLFGPGAQQAGAQTLIDVPVQHPMEIAAGLSYEGIEHFKFSFDYRWIDWGSATTYSQLGWSNQNVFALGAQYSQDAWAVRAGFNYAASPISNASGENGLGQQTIAGVAVFNQSISLIDVAALPAFSTTSITVGGGYKITNDLNVNVAFLYSPSATLTRSGDGLVGGTPGKYTYTGTMTQWAAGADVSYQF